MKVLLLNPFLTVHPDDPADISPPLSLAYLAGFLEKRKIKVAVLDIAAEGINQIRKVGKKTRYGLNEREIVKKIQIYAPKIVGITCQSTLHASEAHQTAKIVKKANPEILVVMGGAHPSAVPAEVLQDQNVDLVVRGEGEVTLWEIVREFEGEKVPKDILGTSWRQGKKVINNPLRPLIRNLDSLPFPARHLLPMEIYFQQVKKGVNYNRYSRVITMITSRGCPGDCSYCSVKTVWGRVWRSRSAKNVVDEIEGLIDTYGVREIHFLDDSISVDKKRLGEICEEIIRRRLNIAWTTPNGIAIWLLDKKLLLKMKKAGCYRVTFGLESGNQEILHHYIGKHYDFKQAREIISFCSKIGLWTVGTFIVGFPYETRQQIGETINFALSTDLDFAVFYIANPFLGTQMYKDFLKEGLLKEGEVYHLVRGCQTKYFTHKELKAIQAEAFSRFLQSRLKKPWRLWSKVGSWEDLVYTGRLCKNLVKIVVNQTLIKTRGIAVLWR